jgi:ribonuclease P protein component
MSTGTFDFTWLESSFHPPSVRLREPAEFKRVFAKPERSTDNYFTVLAIVNELKHPRLGLAIAKKHIKRAVDRNKIKRSIRESFRLQQYQIPHLGVQILYSPFLLTNFFGYRIINITIMKGVTP